MHSWMGLVEGLVLVVVLGVIFGPPLAYLLYRRKQARKLSVLWIPSPVTWGLLLAIAINVAVTIWSGMTGFQARSKVSEARSNLGAIYTTQVAYFGEYNAYGDDFTLLNWAPEGESLYAYYIGDDFVPNDKGTPVPYTPDNWPFTIRPGADASGFTAIAIGNIDNDEFFDVWMITDGKKITRALNDQWNLDEIGFLAEPQTRAYQRRVKVERFLDSPANFLILLVPLFILSVLVDELRWLMAKRRKQ